MRDVGKSPFRVVRPRLFRSSSASDGTETKFRRGKREGKVSRSRAKARAGRAAEDRLQRRPFHRMIDTRVAREVLPRGPCGIASRGSWGARGRARRTMILSSSVLSLPRPLFRDALWRERGDVSDRSRCVVRNGLPTVSIRTRRRGVLGTIARRAEYSGLRSASGHEGRATRVSIMGASGAPRYRGWRASTSRTPERMPRTRTAPSSRGIELGLLLFTEKKIFSVARAHESILTENRAFFVEPTCGHGKLEFLES